VSGAQAGAPTNRPLSRKIQRTATIIHRTVWCTPDCPVSQSCPRQQMAARSAGNMWTSPTVGRLHQTVRCATRSVAPTVDFTTRVRNGEKVRNRQKNSATARKSQQSEGHTRLSVVPSDCPVRHRGRWLQRSTLLEKEENRALFTIWWCIFSIKICGL
jgi:hypothetical protein